MDCMGNLFGFRKKFIWRKLPYISLAIISVGLISCGEDNGSSNSSVKITGVSFNEVLLPQTDEDLKNIKVSNKLTVSYDDGSKKTYNLSYVKVAKSGDVIGNNWSYGFGTLYDKDLNPIREKDNSIRISNNPDADSILTAGNDSYLITHFEEASGALYRTKLSSQNGKVKAQETYPIDFKAVGGTLINCAGRKTPWNTHLGAEEDYSLNSRYADKSSPYYVDCDTDNSGYFTGTSNGEHNWFCSYVAGMQKYLNDLNIDKNNGYNGDEFSPYNYGYIVEVKVNDDGTTDVAKHYVTGKYTPELAVVMPDNKTLYITDDGTAKGLYKLVLDEPVNGFKKNWKGTLYIAKVTQVSSENGGEFNVDWIKLGHASDSQIKDLIDRKLKLSDIFEIGDVNSCDTNNGFKLIFEDSKLLCLKLRTGNNRSSKFNSDDEVKTAAAFLESRKYGAYLGGTTEFRKEEGLAYNPDKNVLYVAISAIEKSMEDNYKGKEPANHIKLPKNKCGGIYELKLDNNYNGTKLKGILVGKVLDKNDPNDNEWYCDPNNIANPDNIEYIGHNILLIGEDTSKHLVNMVWAYDLENKKLTRIGHVPIGAEVTGSFAKGEIGNEFTIWMNAQHPFDEAPDNRNGEPVRQDIINNASDEDKKGIVGYISGIPTGVFK